MLPVRIFTAYGILVSIALYIYPNVKVLSTIGGYGALALAMLLFLVLIVVSGDLFNLAIVRSQTIFLVLFIAYFYVKWMFESTSTISRQQTFFGTTGGIVFAFSLGMISSYALSKLYEVRHNPKVSGIIYMLGMMYMVLVVYLGWDIFRTHLGDIGSDKFLIEDEDSTGLYQRAGNLLTIQLIIIIALSVMFAVSAPKVKLIATIPNHAVVVLLMIMYGGTSQAVGSNSGLFASAGFSAVYLITMFTLRFMNRPDRNISILDMLLGRLGVELFLATLFGLVAVAVAMLAAVQISGIDVSTLRATGFGTGELTSWTSRQEVASNFSIHFSYSPIFGNTQVDRLTTGTGTYAHKLSGMLPFVGLVGTVIFSVMVFCLYKEISKNSKLRGNTIFTNRQYALFRMLILGAALVLCELSAFFTWVVLWFCLGLVGDWFLQRHYTGAQSSTQPRQSTRRRSRRTRQHDFG